jgi:thiamine biosynthesis lipoprotein
MKVLLFFFLIPFSINAQQLSSYSKDTLLMGGAFAFTALHANREVAKNAVNLGIAEVARIEALISSWQVSSQTSEINRNAGKQPVLVDKELFNLIERSLKISQLSQGYFDISFASIDKIWSFKGQSQEMPSDSLLAASVAYINYKDIVLNKATGTVFLKNPGMKIGFGAIGKGYAADKAKEVMLALGIEDGVVNAGGDLLAWGYKGNGKVWSIGIADPNDKNRVLSNIEITNQAIVTSGDYEKYVLINDERYGHIINPKTGLPAKGIFSVTIIANSAEIADALATTVFVLGPEEGLKLIDYLEGVECIIVNSKNKILYSKGVNLNLVPHD